ncbi:ankyrin repeat domain-containing protein [Halomonas sp. DQ26W]|uniref:ankyrin repeat domain-containing protein n=1 Tax=Halomonas sp. DQ26W TaxID=2282311 RepID=UPI000DF83AEB|nr:ankyrin repeat domain-containing protein [Halomonas sp. DQ26W]RDB41891.1 ankyrin repeat domain-containing protein [Halomonas sp. DQ26W]
MHTTRTRYGQIHWAIFILLLTALLVSGCQPSKGLSMSRNYSAEDIFTGPQLELARAIERNDMAALRRGAEGVDLNAQGKQQMTLMWFAMMRKNTDAIRTLVELGVHPSDDAMDGMPARTPLGAALMSEDTFYLEAMLDGGLSPNDGDEDGIPLLEKAVISGTLNHVKLLVKDGAHIEATTREGKNSSAFDESTLGTKPEIAIYLLEQGAIPDFRSETGVTTAWRIQNRLDELKPGPMRDSFTNLRNMMIERGVQFPPPSPLEVREQMRTEGLTPVVPFGHDR